VECTKAYSGTARWDADRQRTAGGGRCGARCVRTAPEGNAEPAAANRARRSLLVAIGPSASTPRDDMRKLKVVLEGGKAVSIEGQPSARDELRQHVRLKLYRTLRSGGQR
jgi:hypothetical protein